MKTCPEFSLLSQLFDHELGKAQEKELRQHVGACAACQMRLSRIEQTEDTLRAARAASAASPQRGALTPDCLSPEQIAAYVQHTVSLRDHGQAERHLQTCDPCLTEVQDAFRHTSLTSTKKQPVPASLKTRVAALWEDSLQKEQPVPFSRFVVQLAQQGMRLIEQHIVSPLLDIEEIFALSPAYRAGEAAPSILTLKITANQAEIKATMAQEGHRIAVKMTLLDAEQEALAGQRFFLRQQGKPIFSAKTDAAGVLRMPAVEPGVYEVACPGVQAIFQLELRV